ncbi:MAG: SPASM domain-containing protein [Candidatus Omnitrophica bacterium]|nr:SPASM domain-containing protein [Candidatus Omnitrophota bacterium]
MKHIVRSGLNYFQAIVKSVNAFAMPEHVQVEVTTYCNLNCLACGRRSIVQTPLHMKFDDFVKIYDQIRPRNINLSGLGEPLLNPDIFTMIRYCVERGSVVNFPTNLVVSSSAIEKLVDSEIDQIKVSFDAASSDVYKKVRQCDRFNVVINNIKLINTLKKERSITKPEIRFNFCLEKENVYELPCFIELAKEFDVKMVYVQDLNYFSVEDMKKELCGIGIQELTDILTETKRKADWYGIATNIDNWMRHMKSLHNKMLARDEFIPNRITCHFPWVSAFIDVKGNVKPCPVFVWDKDAPSLGNCLQKPFASIWNGERYRRVREEFRKGIRSFAICERCVPPSFVVMKLIVQKMLLRKKR